MKNLLNKMVIPQDKAKHFVWIAVILMLAMAAAVVVDTILELNLNFLIMVGFSLIVTAVIQLLKEIKRGTLPLIHTLANFCGLLIGFGLLVLAIIAYK